MTISINVFIFAIIEIVWLAYAMNGDSQFHDKLFGISQKDVRLLLFVLGSVVLASIWGGIFWW